MKNMSKEKLTVDLLISKLLANYNYEQYNQGDTTQKNREVVYAFLKQIREDLYKNTDNTYGIIEIGHVSRIFADYLNLK